MKAVSSALRTAYPVEPSSSFNADIAALLDALDKRTARDAD